MTVSIKCGNGEFDGVKTSYGTKVFTKKGHEIQGITNIHINIAPNDVVRAVFEVIVNDIRDMDNVKALLGINTLEEIVSMHGFKLVPLHNA